MTEPLETFDRDDRVSPLPVMPHTRRITVGDEKTGYSVGENYYCPKCKTKLVSANEACPSCLKQAQSLAEPAKRYDAGKTPLADFDTFFDEGFAAEIGAAFRYGAIKYGKDNWKAGMSWCRCLNSCRRHLLAFWRGEKTDPESGVHHLALAVCSIMFLFVYERDNIGKDTR